MQEALALCRCNLWCDAVFWHGIEIAGFRITNAERAVEGAGAAGGFHPGQRRNQHCASDRSGAAAGAGSVRH
ncbi:hypothetical protein D3C87_1691660 [compost metagenome]